MTTAAYWLNVEFLVQVWYVVWFSSLLYNNQLTFQNEYVLDPECIAWVEDSILCTYLYNRLV